MSRYNYFELLVNAQGHPIPYGTVTVNVHGGGAATVYPTEGGAAGPSGTATADSYGIISFWLDPNVYDIYPPSGDTQVWAIPQGTPGVAGNPRGVWNSGTTYDADDQVFSLGLPYISLVGTNLNHLPTPGGDAFWGAINPADGPTNVATMRTLGTGAQQAAPGGVIGDGPLVGTAPGPYALRDVVSIMDPEFGGPVSGDWTTAMAAANAVGKPIAFPDGSYPCHPGMFTVSLLAQDNGAELVNLATGASADFIHIAGSHCKVEGLTVDGKRANFTVAGGGGAIAVYKPAGNVAGSTTFAGGMILGTGVSANATSIAVVTATFGGVELQPGDMISFVEGATGEHAMVAPTYTAGATTVPLYEPLLNAYTTAAIVTCCPTEVTVSECNVRGVGRDGIYFWNPFGGGMFDNVAYDAVDTCFDLPNGGQDVVIQGNRYYTNGRWGIGVDTGDLNVFTRQAKGVVIADNPGRLVSGGVPVDAAGAAIDGIYVGRSFGTIVRGNPVNLEKGGVPGTQGQSGINLVGAAMQAIVSGNPITCSGQTTCMGVRYTPYAGQTQDVKPKINGNQILGADMGIALEQIINAVVNDNGIFGTIQYGIDIERHATTVQTLIAMGNHIDGGVVGIRGGGTTGASSVIKTGLNAIFNQSFAPIATDTGWTSTSISGFA